MMNAQTAPAVAGQIEASVGRHTPGPWRWEMNRKSKVLHLVGGRPQYDLTIMDFDRWGMGRAVATLRDPSDDGMNIMHRLCDRPDWIAPFPGRAHHADWCADVTHPDMRLIAAAPMLLDALQKLYVICRDCDLEIEAERPTEEQYTDAMDAAEAALASVTPNVKLTGVPPTDATKGG